MKNMHSPHFRNRSISKSIAGILSGAVAFVCWLATPSFADDSFEKITNRFNNFDLNGDGIDEINQLSPFRFAKNSTTGLKFVDKVLIVLIEDRLLKFDETTNQRQLSPKLELYARTLEKDGWSPVFIRASVYSGELHQDGRTVLAIRRFFQAVKRSYPNFAGAVLIGSFPESMLVRRWVWKHNSRSATFNCVTYNKGNGPKATFLAMDPELISHRSDVVLCDLDGNWEDIYVQQESKINSIKLLPDETITKQPEWPSFEQTITTDKFSIKQKTFQDYFFIDDVKMEIVKRSDKSITIKCAYQMDRPEVGKPDLGTANPLARPDIIVSRINTRHVAVIQPAKNLDDGGKPKSIPKSAGSPNRQFVRDIAFERRLLVEYLERNINHRGGNTEPEAMNVASMWTDLQTPSRHYLGGVAKQLGGIETFPKATAVDFSRFMKTPAIVKGVSAHSNPTCSSSNGLIQAV